MNKKKFFVKQAKQGLALTYDDVVLQTDYSSIPPNDVVLETNFSRNIKLKIPIVSAAMDTVTDHRMAIAMATLGGIGVIHRNMSIEQQVWEVERVKFRLNGLIQKPICVQMDETIEQISNRRREKGWDFESFPVIDAEGRLQGILTGNDFKYCTSLKQTAQEVMTKDPITQRENITTQDAFAFLQREKRGVLPLVDSNNVLKGMYVFSDLKRIESSSLSMCTVDTQNRLRVAAAIGVGDAAIERAKALANADVDAVVIDTAHGHTKDMIRTIALMRKIPALEAVDIIIGNISQSRAVRCLGRISCGNPKAGANFHGIKVGQGPGSICTTRVVSGAGRPQLTAVYECSEAGTTWNLPAIADGGIRQSGDITKAIAAGASCVMLGSMLAGTEESPGNTIHHEGKMVKDYRGMGSLGAMSTGSGGAERYRQADSPPQKLVPEGVESYVPFRGPVADVIHQCLGGLRAGMGYVGAASIDELQLKSRFERVTSAGNLESHPHDVTIIRDAPNYSQ